MEAVNALTSGTPLSYLGFRGKDDNLIFLSFNILIYISDIHYIRESLAQMLLIIIVALSLCPHATFLSFIANAY